jgi:AcrR family transcriptional regulator
MAERRDKTGNGRAHATLRGDVTRDRLLDAIEAIAAETGFEGLSHRVIAKRARLHSALVHYHFGTVDHLLEEAVARRAQRMSQQQRAALSALLSRGRWTVEDVVAALWEPFGSLGGTIDDGWRNYLCLVARLANNPRGDKPLDRHFGDVITAALRALQTALPDADEPTLRTGLRFARALFENEALLRCQSAYPSERRALDDRRVVTFAAAGIRSLAGTLAGSAPTYVYARAAGGG